MVAQFQSSLRTLIDISAGLKSRLCLRWGWCLVLARRFSRLENFLAGMGIVNGFVEESTIFDRRIFRNIRCIGRLPDISIGILFQLPQNYL